MFMYVPIIFFLLPEKEPETYSYVLSPFCNFILNVTVAVADFEAANLIGIRWLGRKREFAVADLISAEAGGEKFKAFLRCWR